MRKFDYFFISISSIIIIILLVAFTPKIKVNNENFYLEVKYNNETIIELNINDEGIYKFDSKDEKLNIYKDDNLLKCIECTKSFLNIIEIKNGKVKMIDASCRGKDCMNMYISKDHLLPIICTNGIIIIPKSDSNIDVVI